MKSFQPRIRPYDDIQEYDLDDNPIDARRRDLSYGFIYLTIEKSQNQQADAKDTEDVSFTGAICRFSDLNSIICSITRIIEKAVL